jgi:hypothetical protein
MINSQGKATAKSYLEQVAREQEYLAAVRAILDKRDAAGGWTVGIAAEYKALLVRNGILQDKPVPKKT